MAIAYGALVSATASADPSVTVKDTRFNTASNFLAYTEFELSGEPLAESLGLDLDTLDSDQNGQPTLFDYQAGIESYEYSEEAMYALNYQSRMGVNLLNGPRNEARKTPLKQHIEKMALAVGMPAEDIPNNLYLLSLPYKSGQPKLNLKDKVTYSAPESLDVLNAEGKTQTLSVVEPNYMQDYQHLNWQENSFDKVINPAALAGILLKEVMWSQDFMGGMHETETDEEVEGISSTQDHSKQYSLGVSAADGFNGLLLTELSIDKMRIMQEQLGFDGKRLGAKIDFDYDPEKSPVWFPHGIMNHEKNKNGVKALGHLHVTAKQSTLRDSWMLLWALSEYFAYTDQRTANTAQNPSFLAVFDGAPFESAPSHNTDGKSNNDRAAHDAFSLSANLSNLVFKNLSQLHFDGKQKTLVDTFDGKSANNTVNVFDASYALVALSIYQRAQDALPVGYAAGDGGDVNLKTSQGKRALALIKAQADFLLENAVAKNGLLADDLTLGGKVSEKQTLATQFAGIRGLVSAGLALKDNRYMEGAKALYLAVEKNMYDAKLGTWADQPGDATIHTPWTAAAISGGLRSAMLNLANSGEEKNAEPALSLKQLAKRYESWFGTVINGGAQLSEMNIDTGEHALSDPSDTDADNDGVKSIVGAGFAPVLAAEVLVKP